MGNLKYNAKKKINSYEKFFFVIIVLGIFRENEVLSHSIWNGKYSLIYNLLFVIPYDKVTINIGSANLMPCIISPVHTCIRYCLPRQDVTCGLLQLIKY